MRVTVGCRFLILTKLSSSLHRRSGDANNAILAAVGYNFSLLLRVRRSYCA
jgi:hypothetical protein